MKPESKCQRCGDVTLKGVRLEYKTSDGEYIDVFVNMCPSCQ